MFEEKIMVMIDDEEMEKKESRRQIISDLLSSNVCEIFTP
jgi:hypothetical protein